METEYSSRYGFSFLHTKKACGNLVFFPVEVKYSHLEHLMQRALKHWIWHGKSCLMLSTWSLKVLTCRVPKLVSSSTFAFSSCPRPSSCGGGFEVFWLVAMIFPLVVGVKGLFVILVWGSCDVPCGLNYLCSQPLWLPCQVTLLSIFKQRVALWFISVIIWVGVWVRQFVNSWPFWVSLAISKSSKAFLHWARRLRYWQHVVIELLPVCLCLLFPVPHSPVNAALSGLTWGSPWLMSIEHFPPFSRMVLTHSHTEFWIRDESVRCEFSNSIYQPTAPVQIGGFM